MPVDLIRIMVWVYLIMWKIQQVRILIDNIILSVIILALLLLLLLFGFRRSLPPPVVRSILIISGIFGRSRLSSRICYPCIHTKISFGSACLFGGW